MLGTFNQHLLMVRDYGDTKIGCVPVACHLLCKYMSSRTVPCAAVASFGLFNQITLDFSACVMSDKDVFLACVMSDTDVLMILSDNYWYQSNCKLTSLSYYPFVILLLWVVPRVNRNELYHDKPTWHSYQRK